MPRRQQLLAPAAVLGGLAAATLALRLRDPHVPGSWGVCPSAAVGFWCPGCGGLRAVNDLTHGRLAEAASSNLLLVVLLPVAVVALAAWALARWRGTSPAWPLALLRPTAYASVAVLVAFTVLRNLPAGAWLAP